MFANLAPNYDRTSHKSKWFLTDLAVITWRSWRRSSLLIMENICRRHRGRACCVGTHPDFRSCVERSHSGCCFIMTDICSWRTRNKDITMDEHVHELPRCRHSLLILSFARWKTCAPLKRTRSSFSCQFFMNHYIISDAFIVYCITVNVAKATTSPFSTIARCITYQREPRIAMRENVVQKKKMTRKKKIILHVRNQVQKIRVLRC